MCPGLKGEMITQLATKYYLGGAQTRDWFSLVPVDEEGPCQEMNVFKAYIVSEINQSVEDLIRKEDKTEEEIKEDLAKLSKVFSKYLWTLRVDVMVRN